MLQRTVLSIKSGCYNEHRCYNENFINKIRMLPRTNATTNSFINKIRMLPRTNATTNSFINKIRMLQQRTFINKIRMLQRTVFISKIRMLQQTLRNTVGRRSTRVRVTCRAFPLWLECQSSSLLSSVRFSFHFSSVLRL